MTFLYNLGTFYQTKTAYKFSLVTLFQQVFNVHCLRSAVLPNCTDPFSSTSASQVKGIDQLERDLIEILHWSQIIVITTLSDSDYDEAACILNITFVVTPLVASFSSASWNQTSYYSIQSCRVTLNASACAFRITSTARYHKAA